MLSMTTTWSDFTLSPLSVTTWLNNANRTITIVFHSFSKKIQLRQYVKQVATDETQVHWSDSITPNGQTSASYA